MKNMPGFNADVSLYRTNEQYRMMGVVNGTPIYQQVFPQISYSTIKCIKRCLIPFPPIWPILDRHTDATLECIIECLQPTTPVVPLPVI